MEQEAEPGNEVLLWEMEAFVAGGGEKRFVFKLYKSKSLHFCFFYQGKCTTGNWPFLNLLHPSFHPAPDQPDLSSILTPSYLQPPAPSFELYPLGDAGQGRSDNIC